MFVLASELPASVIVSSILIIMPCLISCVGKTARLDYSEEATEEEIKNARFALNGNDRFYDCKNLIIDVTKCSLEHIQVSKLLVVVATDLGASRIVKSLKVAFLVSPSSIWKW